MKSACTFDPQNNQTHHNKRNQDNFKAFSYRTSKNKNNTTQHNTTQHIMISHNDSNTSNNSQTKQASKNKLFFLFFCLLSPSMSLHFISILLIRFLFSFNGTIITFLGIDRPNDIICFFQQHIKRWFIRNFRWSK